MSRCGFCLNRSKFTCADRWCTNTHNTNQCPFLKVTKCMRCYKLGHCESRCTHYAYMQDLWNQMKAEDIDPIERRMAGVYHAWETQRLITAKLNHSMTMAAAKADKLTHEDMKNNSMCSCCYDVNRYDAIFMTHQPRDCPRLACNMCRKCNQRGHRESHCPQVAGDLVLDFSDDDDELLCIKNDNISLQLMASCVVSA